MALDLLLCLVTWWPSLSTRHLDESPGIGPTVYVCLAMGGVSVAWGITVGVQIGSFLVACMHVCMWPESNESRCTLTPIRRRE